MKDQRMKPNLSEKCVINRILGLQNGVTSYQRVFSFLTSSIHSRQSPILLILRGQVVYIWKSHFSPFSPQRTTQLVTGDRIVQLRIYSPKLVANQMTQFGCCYVVVVRHHAMSKMSDKGGFGLYLMVLLNRLTQFVKNDSSPTRCSD